MESSKIEWTDHTFNPWWGCMKVSTGCKNCYAEKLDNRWKGGHWGPGSARKSMSDEYWRQPLKWNNAAATAGQPAKVFCASMADVFEGHPDTLPHLRRLFRLIEQTPHLIWQLLTKRPENIMDLIPGYWLTHNGMPDNLWIGTSVENQEAADQRIPHLLKVPAKVRFLSCEPLLGPIVLRRKAEGSSEIVQMALMGHLDEYTRPVERGIDWVIAGGESGPGARPMHPDWVRSIRDQCTAAGVPFFFKQWGEYLPYCQSDINTQGKIKEFKSPNNPWKMNKYFKTGKKLAGRLLDGKEWDQFPT